MFSSSTNGIMGLSLKSVKTWTKDTKIILEDGEYYIKFPHSGIAKSWELINITEDYKNELVKDMPLIYNMNKKEWFYGGSEIIEMSFIMG